ncbi:MAG: orotate phosphoribosyltransferase [Nitrospirae bacterium]|nr:MAG: orotate phosphoribosyltransferase [Nitrospirota bacterium]
MDTTQMKRRLLELIYKRAFKYSEAPVFKLVSGRTSSYYFNCKTVTLHPEGMYLIGNVIFSMIKDLRPAGIGGLTLGADPLADAVAYTSFVHNAPIEAVVVRKSAKPHGMMQWIEGNIAAGDSVVVVDDVITTGKSTIEAIARMHEAGLRIVKVIALVDRQEGGYEAIAGKLKEIGADAPIESVVRRDDVMALYRQR